MKDALLYIVSAIVDNPKEVVIDESEDEEGIVLTITVAKADMGKVIGKNGRIIRAIRNVMKIPAIKQGKRISINLSEQAPEQVS